MTERAGDREDPGRPVYRVVVEALAPDGAATPGGARAFDLDREVALVGSRTGVDVPLPHPAVAGVHLRLERDGAGVRLVDAGAGQTRLNGAPLAPGASRPLADGDELDVAGAFRLRYAAAAPGGATPATAERTADLARALVRDVLAALGREGDDAAPSLQVVEGPGRGSTIALPAPGGELVLGRGESCDATILDPDLSREHLRVRRDWGGVEVADLGSKNGTAIDGARLVAGGARRLRNGDRIALGGTVLLYRDPTAAPRGAAALAEAPAAPATPGPDAPALVEAPAAPAPLTPRAPATAAPAAPATPGPDAPALVEAPAAPAPLTPRAPATAAPAAPEAARPSTAARPATVAPPTGPARPSRWPAVVAAAIAVALALALLVTLLRS